MEKMFLESIPYVLPALITGGVAYFMFSGFLKQGNQEKKLELLAQKKKESLPIKLQAFERMLLYCERINPTNLAGRIMPTTNDTNNYLELLIATINTEYDHNLVQQLYMSDETWKVILTCKNALIQQ